MADPGPDEDRAAAARAAAQEDARALAAIVRELWDVAPDPFGLVRLLPRAGAPAGDPLPVDALPWPAVVERFRERHGRPPAPGARTLATRSLGGGAGPG